MPKDFFYTIGKLIFSLRWLIIVIWLGLFAACLPFVPKLMDPFKAIGFSDPKSDSAKANDVLSNRLGYSYNRFIIMYRSDTLLATSPTFLNDVKNSLAGLKKIKVDHQIVYPSVDNKQISEDKHAAYAMVLFKGKEEVDQHLLDKFKTAVKEPPNNITMKLGGEPIFLDDTKRQTQLDLYHAEYIATPVAIVTMLLVFRSVVAASLPIILGGFGAIFILIALYILGHFFSLSVFTINIALLLGLCLSLDYAILIINRYREELLRGNPPDVALAITQTTAGKSVFFSGLAVFVSLSALLLFPINILFSVGVGGLAAVFVSVTVALILLPAILAVVKNGINRFSIVPIRKVELRKHSSWYLLVTEVVKRPFIFFFSTLIILLTLGYPFLHAKFGISDFRILPPTMQSRQVFDTFKTEFGESKLAPILILIKTPDKTILTEKNIGHLYNFAKRLKNNPAVAEVHSIVSINSSMTKQQYQMMYTHLDHLPSGIENLLKTTTDGNLTVITIISKYMSNSPTTTAFIKHLRAMHPGGNLTLEVTGTSVNTIDVLKSISHIFPFAFLWIVGFTYLVLLVLLRSVILPLKAIITTVLSLCASYGVLVVVFQVGHLHHLLNFEPQGMLDISLLIIIFCALFGISMDYEVFLLTRIKEFYEHTHDTNRSIIMGIDRSWKIISSAAIIVIGICFSFMSADILMVKAFGLGIAVAVFVDAFIIRMLLVPATMRILQGWNWYMPKWLGYIIPKIKFDP